MVYSKLHPPNRARITPLERAERAAARKRGKAAHLIAFDTAVYLEVQVYGSHYIRWFLRGWYDG